MRKRLKVTVLVAALAALGGPIADAAEEDTTARLREMLHRTQEALRQAQADGSELARAKGELEQKLRDANSQLDAAEKDSKASAAALHARLGAAQGVQGDLNQKLAAAGAETAAANTKITGLTRELEQRQSEITQLNQTVTRGRNADDLCEAKNLKLYEYGEDLLQAYRKKGVWSALEQKEPVLGLKEVGIENIVQEYQAKLASQKSKP